MITAKESRSDVATIRTAEERKKNWRFVLVFYGITALRFWQVKEDESQ